MAQQGLIDCKMHFMCNVIDEREWRHRTGGDAQETH